MSYSNLTCISPHYPVAVKALWTRLDISFNLTLFWENKKPVTFGAHLTKFCGRNSFRRLLILYGCTPATHKMVVAAIPHLVSLLYPLRVASFCKHFRRRLLTNIIILPVL